MRRVQCPRCRRWVSVRRDGLVRTHGMEPRHAARCDGSGASAAGLPFEPSEPVWIRRAETLPQSSMLHPPVSLRRQYTTPNAQQLVRRCPECGSRVTSLPGLLPRHHHPGEGARCGMSGRDPAHWLVALSMVPGRVALLSALIDGGQAGPADWGGTRVGRLPGGDVVESGR